MIGVISDDLTGCGDVGLHFADYGLRTVVYASDFACPRQEPKLNGNWDVLVVNTESRVDEPGKAYEKVRAVLSFFRKSGIKQIYKKIDSTLRGNIGPEIDALFDGLKIERLPFCAAVPRMGRTTRGGYHYVEGELVTRTEFSRDSRSQVNQSHIPTLLKGTSRYYERVEVYDATSQNDLRNIASEIKDYEAICGASGLAEELVKYWGKPGARRGVKSKTAISGPGPVLIISGSAKSITYEQIEELKEEEEEVLAVPIDFERNRVKIPDWENAMHILVYPKKSSYELDREKVLKVLSRITAELCQGGLFRDLIIIGGDTAFSVCQGLGIDTFQIISSVFPGTAYCRTLDRSYNFILKPGGLGDRKALIRCLRFFYDSRSR